MEMLQLLSVVGFFFFLDSTLIPSRVPFNLFPILTDIKSKGFRFINVLHGLNASTRRRYGSGWFWCACACACAA